PKARGRRRRSTPVWRGTRRRDALLLLPSPGGGRWRAQRDGWGLSNPDSRVRLQHPPSALRAPSPSGEREMTLILQTLADGLVLGGIYALAAVGFSLIFGVLHVINLSHGILVLLGAYLALTFSQVLRIDPLLTMPLVMAALFVIGYGY